jgi:flavin-binding protein dodecin
MDGTYEGTSMESFEDAARNAMPPLHGPVPASFEVVGMGISHGGMVGVPQYRVTLRQLLLQEPGESSVG